MEGRNPPLPLNFVTSTRLPDDRSCSTEDKPDDRPLLPPNYVSLRELRERRLKEEQERERSREGGKASEGADRRHPSSYITVRELEEELLREVKEKERKGHRDGDGRGGESGDRAPLPRDYISLRELQAQRLKEGKMSDERDEGKAKEEEKEKVRKEEREEKKLKELRLQEKDQKGAKEKGRFQRTKVQEEGDDSGKTEKKINSKLCDRARNLSSKEADRVCHVKSGWVWEPKLPAAGSSTDISSVEPMVSAENAGASHEVLTVSSDQNGKNKWKGEKKKKKKKKNWKRDSGKGKHEPALNAEQPMEVTGVKVAEAPKTSSKGLEEVALSENGNGTVRKVKGEYKNTNEASSQLVPGFGDVKRLNGTRSRGIRAHKGGNRVKNKEANLSGPCRDVVSMSEVEKGFDGVKEATGTEIETGKELKDKGTMVNILELIDQYPSHEEAKEVHGVGDLIGSEIGSSEVKGRSRNVSLSESSETGGQLGDRWRKRNLAAGSRGRGRPRAERFSVRPAERLSGGGGFVWVPKTPFLYIIWS